MKAPKRLTKRQARRKGVSYHGKVNHHMVYQPVLAEWTEGDVVVTYFKGGLVARYTPSPAVLAAQARLASSPALSA